MPSRFVVDRAFKRTPSMSISAAEKTQTRIGHSPNNEQIASGTAPANAVSQTLGSRGKRSLSPSMKSKIAAARVTGGHQRPVAPFTESAIANKDSYPDRAATTTYAEPQAFISSLDTASTMSLQVGGPYYVFESRRDGGDWRERVDFRRSAPKDPQLLHRHATANSQSTLSS